MDDTITNLISDIKHIDEFDVFRNLIKKFKDEKKQVLFNYVDSLDEKKKDFLKEILKNKRIEINHESGKSIARIVVSVKKKKINN